MSKRDEIETYHSKVSNSLLTLVLKNDSGICQSTSLVLQITQTTTLIPFTRYTASYKIYQKYDPFYLQFGLLHTTQMDVNNSTNKMNRGKMLHAMHNLSAHHHFQHTNPIIHMNSRLQYANTKLTSPYYMNYSYVVQPNYCEGALRNFDPIKNYFIFSPIYAKTNRPNLVTIEYLQCVEGGATKCTYGHTFSLL